MCDLYWKSAVKPLVIGQVKKYESKNVYQD